MNLHDKYLRHYDFNEIHQTVIDAPIDVIYRTVRALDFSDSWIIRLLFFLRGLPASRITVQSMQEHRFFVLEELDQAQLIIGLIGQFWKPTGKLQVFKPSEFMTFKGPYAKATWNFTLEPYANKILVRTETRIACPDSQTKRSFSRYWFFIRPFSGLIRKEMLRAIRLNAERQARQPYA